MKNKNLFKKAVSLSLLIICLFNLSGCQTIFLNKSDLVIEVETKDYSWIYDKDKNYDTCYYSLYSNKDYSDKKIKKSEAFIADETEVFIASPDCFDSYIDRIQNKVLNRLRYTNLTDKDGNDVEITPVISEIFEETAKLEHDILRMEIIKDGDEYFVFVSLNVNWWTPCTLYYFNQDSSKLIKLYTFDYEIVTGIKIHDLSILK